MAQLVKHPTLDLSSGHDLTVHGFEPCVGVCTDSTEPASDAVSASLSLSLKINKLKKKKTYLDLYLLIWTKIHDLSDIPLPEKRQVDQGSTNFFFKGPDSTYFQFFRQHVLCTSQHSIISRKHTQTICKKLV